MLSDTVWTVNNCNKLQVTQTFKGSYKNRPHLVASDSQWRLGQLLQYSLYSLNFQFRLQLTVLPTLELQSLSNHSLTLRRLCKKKNNQQPPEFFPYIIFVLKKKITKKKIYHCWWYPWWSSEKKYTCKKKIPQCTYRDSWVTSSNSGEKGVWNCCFL